MSTVTHRFDKVVYRATKRGPCAACGEYATRSSGEMFMQTLNPLNKNAKGEVKSRSEIMAELRLKAGVWMASPLYHARCEPEE